MKLIEEAWAKAVAGEAHPRVLTFVALGGEGKTALVAKWAIGMAEKDWPDCEAAFAWSFYSQGTREQLAASSDLFLAEALKFFGAPAVEGVESGHDKGRRLAKWIGDKRAALILDGLEPLQYAPTSPLAGELKDEGLRALLKGLAQHNKASASSPRDTRSRTSKATARPRRKRTSRRFPRKRARGCWRVLGVKGTRQEREQLSEDVKGHALTLNLIGSYLRDAYGGDIRKRDLIKLEEADAEEQGGHAFRAMDAYVDWFESDGEKGQRALAMLRLMGLFDRPADAGCLAALWQAPAIEGLTEPLIALSEAQRNIVLTRLADAKLVTVNRDAGGALVSLDAHPLLREYFAKDLRETRAEAWKAAHRRLYEHLTTTTPDKQAPTLDDLQPLYQAVAHGCHAGMQQEACDKVYHRPHSARHGVGRLLQHQEARRLWRGPRRRRLLLRPALAAGLAQSRRRRPSAGCSTQAAFRLRALGRLAEALEPMRRPSTSRVEQENWIERRHRSRQSERIGVDARATLAPRSATAKAPSRTPTGAATRFQRMTNRATHADALHQAGRRAEAEARFVEAEAMQAERQPEYPLLYSLAGLSIYLRSAAWRRRRAGRKWRPHAELGPVGTAAGQDVGALHSR